MNVFLQPDNKTERKKSSVLETQSIQSKNFIINKNQFKKNTGIFITCVIFTQVFFLPG